MALVHQNHWAVTLTVDGAPVPGVFDSFEGGRVAGEATQYRPGGMAEAETSVSPPVVEEITISRGYRAERDAVIEKWLSNRIGAACVVGKQALNPDRSAVPGGLTTYRGRIVSIDTPSHDSNGTEVTRLAVTIGVDGLPS